MVYDAMHVSEVLEAVEHLRKNGEPPWKALQRAAIEWAMVECDGNQTDAALLLRVPTLQVHRFVYKRRSET